MILYLIGMMGSGKTTIGNLLKKKLDDYEHIDLDWVIEYVEEQSVASIIENKGIDYFRFLEYEILHNIDYDMNIIVSTGGGIILNKDNVLFMKSRGTVIYLDVSLDILKTRLMNQDLSNRPLLNQEMDTLDQIYKERKGLYEEASDLIIKCDNLNKDEVVIEIIKNLTK